MRTKLIAAAAAAALIALVPFAASAEEGAPAPQAWSWNGVFGKYDTAQLKRGFQVYHDVCSNCHAMKLLAYRNLGGDDGIGFSDDEVKKIAAEKQVPDEPNDEGKVLPRAAKPSDRFVSPFPNDNAARASNGGALPPDLSLMTKAREHGPDYVYAILTGFVFDKDGNPTAPAGVTVTPGKYYNKAFAGNMISMPPPIAEATLVTYADGTKNSVEQEARDITAFLNWAAEPELNVRHNLGIKVLILAGLLTILAYLVKRRVWADVH